MVRHAVEIEMFHKILKSDWRAEDSKLRTALANLMGVFCTYQLARALAHHAQSHGFGRPRSHCSMNSSATSAIDDVAVEPSHST